MIEEQNVVQWHIHSNGSTVNVTIKFAMPGHVVQSPMTQPPMNSMRIKSPAQLQRNDNRAMAWNQSTPQTNCEFYQPSFGTEYNRGENAKVRDLSEPNIELSASAPSYVPESMQISGQVDKAEHSTHMEHKPELDTATPGQSDPPSLHDIIDNVVDSHFNERNSKQNNESDHSEDQVYRKSSLTTEVL